MPCLHEDLMGAPRAHTCFIAPPDLLARLAAHGTEEQRAAALRTIGSSASMRARRSLIAQLLRDPAAQDALAALAAAPTGESRVVYDAGHKGQGDLPGTRARGEGDSASGDAAVNEAFDGAGTTYDFYKEVFGRDSIDGNSLEIVSSVHFGVDYDNAFWNGSQMVYGDGSGQIFDHGALTRAIDIIGHELTHGVTQFTAQLEYRSQPGALNEHFSDVNGSLIKQWSLRQTADEADWLIGAGSLVPGLGAALRSMKEPGTAFDGDRQPANMADYVDLPDDNDPQNDNGGVHINSGIPNRAFSLAAIAIGGYAWEKAGRIWYTTLTEELSSTADFATAANATVKVAGRLFSASEQDAVRRAWETVGVL